MCGDEVFRQGAELFMIIDALVQDITPLPLLLRAHYQVMLGELHAAREDHHIGCTSA